MAQTYGTNAPICIAGFSGGCRGCDTPNVVAPFDKSAIFSHHWENSAIFSYNLVTSATDLYQVAAFMV